MAAFDAIPEWAELYAIFDAIVIVEKRRAVSQTYYTLQSGQGHSPTESMRQALQRHGYLPHPMTTGAEEYEEIMKGAGIWASIQSD